MAGRKHHFIPRFAQNGFISKGTGKRRQTVLYHKVRGPTELNLVNALAERDFYGSAETPLLDSRITDYETNELAPLWAELCKCPAGPVEMPGIPKMLAHFETRTKNFREQLQPATASMLDALLAKVNDKQVMTEVLIRLLKATAPYKALPYKRLKRKAEPLVPLAIKTISGTLEKLNLDECLRNAHNKALLASPTEVRAKFYEGLPFFVQEVENEGLLLGDSMWCVRPKGADRWFSYLDKDAVLETGVLPLSKSRVLFVGKPLQVTTAQLNAIFSRCSREQFIAPANSDYFAQFLPLIGEWADVLPKSELDAMLQQLLTGFVSFIVKTGSI